MKLTQQREFLSQTPTNMLVGKLQKVRTRAIYAWCNADEILHIKYIAECEIQGRMKG